MILTKAQQQWIDDLRKYPERQTFITIGSKRPDGEIKVCAFGQGVVSYCEVNGIEPFHENGQLTISHNQKFIDLGLKGDHKIIRMNDAERLSWAEIADYMEQNKEEVFNEI